MALRRKKESRTTEAPHAEVDRLLREIERHERKKRKQIMVDWVFIGEGPEPTGAYEYAIRHPTESILVMDLQAPKYKVPENMKYIQIDALKWLDSRPLGTVRNIKDEFTFDHVCLGPGPSDPVEQDRRFEELMAAYDRAAGKKGAMPKEILDLPKNERRYVRLIRRVLVSNGRFILTTATDEKLQHLESLLRGEEFDVSHREVPAEEVRERGTKYAKKFLEKGNRVYEITAIRPQD